MAMIPPQENRDRRRRRRARRLGCTDCGAIHDQYRYRRHPLDRPAVRSPGSRWIGTGSRHRQQRRSCRSRSAHRRGTRQAEYPRPHHRRLPLQRPRSADQVSRVRARSRQVPHQPRQRQHRAHRRFEFPHHDRSRGEISEAGAHRRELGLARSDTSHPNDGRELRARRAERRPRSHDGSHGRQRPEFRRIWRRNSAFAPIRLFSARKSAACRI